MGIPSFEPSAAPESDPGPRQLQRTRPADPLAYLTTGDRRERQRPLCLISLPAPSPPPPPRRPTPAFHTCHPPRSLSTYVHVADAR